jgi:putative ABC transport system substrate-binding protein
VFAWCVLHAVHAWADDMVYLVLTEPGGAYEEAAHAFLDGLGGDRDVQVWNMAELPPERVRTMTQGENLVVPIGLRATRYVAAHHAGHGAVLGLMVPRASAEDIRWPSALRERRLAFVFIDQPVERSLELIQALLPRRDRIGAIVSPDNLDILKALEAECARRGLTLNSRVVDDTDDVGPALRRVLGDSDVFLLLPDALVLGGAALQTLLIASYRLRVPVIGFSPGLVKSGAVAAVYSSPAQIGLQGGTLARRWRAGKGLPPSLSPDRFSVDYNSYVARSLGLSLPPEQEVEQQLGAEH